MNRYKFKVEVNQRIVDGILQGYKNYIEERNEKKESMKISTAYAWVRGNHIDDQTATFCEDLGIDFILAKAGYSWGYLQLVHKDERKMFIVKNGKYFDRNNFTRRKEIKGKADTMNNPDNYLNKLSQINHNAAFPRDIQLSFSLDSNSVIVYDDQLTNLSLNEDIEALQEEYDYFYIITYEQDNYGMISKISLLMPSPLDGKAYLVEDLSEYIERSSIDFSDMDTSVVANEFEMFSTEHATHMELGITTRDEHFKKKQQEK